MKSSRPTIREVARRAGVSHQTVSRVLNGSPSVSPETRQRVEAAIAELGYRPNAIARSMARGETRTLACIAPNLTDYTFASIVEGAEQRAREHGYFLVAAAAADPDAFAALVDKLAGQRRVDGLLVINPYMDERYTLIPKKFPLVFVGARTREQPISSVSLDDYQLARAATRHLIEIGCRRLATVTGPLREDCTNDRLDGFRDELQAAGLPFDPALVQAGDWSASSGRDALQRLAAANRLPDGIFAQNDRMALGVLRAARELGIAVPEQLAVIGVDDMPLASYFDPPLSTMRQDMPAIGRAAADLLLTHIRNPKTSPQHIFIPAELITRESTVRA